MGSVMSLNVCGGQRIPFRPGRIDATGPDSNEAVPAPEMGLDETLEIFSKAGFNTADAIGLTACGHTMGSVHHVSLTISIYLFQTLLSDLSSLLYRRAFPTSPLNQQSPLITRTAGSISIPLAERSIPR